MSLHAGAWLSFGLDSIGSIMFQKLRWNQVQPPMSPGRQPVGILEQDAPTAP